MSMALFEDVSRLMHGVATDIVLPSYRRLLAGQIFEKSPGEVVTSVDLEAERHLAAGLTALLPAARIVGEEAVAADPFLLDGIGRGAVWLVDPLDGTANYASGSGPFGMMIALVMDGLPQMGWIYDPLAGRMVFAERGRGAWCDGRRIACPPPARSRPAAALGTHFLPAARRELVHASAAPHFERVPVPMCAAESYARLVLGQDEVMLFQRSLPWDHAAGALVVAEAGGRISHWDRSPYRVGGQGSGVLAAVSDALWEWAASVLLPAATGMATTVGQAA